MAAGVLTSIRLRPVAGESETDKLPGRASAGLRIRFLGAVVKLHRTNKVAKPGGVVVTKKDVLASSDHEALQRAKDSSDCPICDVLRDGQPVGSII
jgi:hypothetical protein